MKTISIERQKNRAILAELTRIADKYLPYFDIKAGAYSSADLIRYIDILQPKDTEITICIEGFNCKFPRFMVFELVNKFERICGISGAKRHKFIIPDAAPIGCEA